MKENIVWEGELSPGRKVRIVSEKPIEGARILLAQVQEADGSWDLVLDDKQELRVYRAFALDMSEEIVTFDLAEGKQEAFQAIGATIMALGGNLDGINSVALQHGTEARFGDEGLAQDETSSGKKEGEAVSEEKKVTFGDLLAESMFPGLKSLGEIARRSYLDLTPREREVLRTGFKADERVLQRYDEWEREEKEVKP